MNIKSFTGLLVFKDNLYFTFRVAEFSSITLDVTTMMHEVMTKFDT
jgi:hypothetical protein